MVRFVGVLSLGVLLCSAESLAVFVFVVGGFGLIFFCLLIVLTAWVFGGGSIVLFAGVAWQYGCYRYVERG